MAKFKMGDRIVCVNNDHVEDDLELGKEYTVLFCGDHELGSTFPAQVGINSYFGEWADNRFELVKPQQEPNGVNAEGKASYFSQDMLKPFMRVVTKSEGTWVCTTTEEDIKTGEPLVLSRLVGNGWNRSMFLDGGDDAHEEEYVVQEVYEVMYRYERFAENAQLKLIWKRQAPKTSEQLAQEAAVTARNKAIEEAEKALNVAQQKLNELKGL